MTFTRATNTVLDPSTPDGDQEKAAIIKNGAAIDNLIYDLNAAGFGVGDLLSTNNLSDLTDADTALDNLDFTVFGKSVATTSNAGTCRTLLGLGDAALKTVGTSSGNVPELDGDGKLATGVIPDGGYLVSANDLSDLSNVGTARTNLGLTSNATANTASQAQAEAGTDNATLMTPLRVAQAIIALAGGGSPVGTVAHYAGPSAPTGWLARDGSAVSRTTYSDLFAVIGTTYGVGDGSTTFNVPDDRDLFDRGVPSGGTVGTYQADALKSHLHTYYVTTTSGGSTFAGSGTGIGNISVDTGSTGDTETRPKNRHYLPIIKY